jgi:hypothetical protein
MYKKLLFNKPVKIQRKTCPDRERPHPHSLPKKGGKYSPFPFWEEGRGMGSFRKQCRYKRYNLKRQ